MNRLLAFYSAEHPDDRGRLLEDILGQDDRWLETTHDYIQWLFPLRERSGANASAPVLDEDVIRAFREDALLRRRLLDSWLRMLSFYGLTVRQGRIVKADHWADRKHDWFTQPTHNDLRITRILKSLSLLGLHEEAARFLACLETLRRSEADCGVCDEAIAYWREAVPVQPQAMPAAPRRAR